MADLVLPPDQTPVSEAGGFATRAWRRFFTTIAQRLGTGTGIDFVSEALGLAENAVPKTTEVIAVAPNVGGGPLSGNVLVQFGLGAFSFADVPSPSLFSWLFCLDGLKTGEGAGTGTGVWAWSDGANWYSIMGGALAA